MGRDGHGADAARDDIRDARPELARYHAGRVPVWRRYQPFPDVG